MRSACETAIFLTSAYVIERRERTWVVTLNREAGEQPCLPGDDGAWLKGEAADELEIRCHALKQANSVLIAWIIRLSQVAPTARLRLTGCDRRVLTLFKRLRIDALAELS